jgi:chromosome segregation ATPase
METGLNQIGLYLQAKEVSQNVKDALQKAVGLRNKLDDTKSKRLRQEQRVAEITAEHSRIRDNMQRLQQNSELYNRYVKKLDQQETEVEGIRKTIEALKSTEEEQRRELQTYLMSLDVG